MGQKVKYDWKQIIQDYESGLSMPDIHKKHGVSTGHVSNKFKELGIRVHHTSYKRFLEWKKLIPTGKCNAGLLITVPKFMLKEMGIDTTKNLEANWETVSKNKLCLNIRYVVKEG